jgi:glycosyltransferase involved in cell wall biosynthesis
MKKIGIVLPDFQTIGAQRVAIDYGIKLKSIGYDVFWLVGDLNFQPAGIEPGKIIGFNPDFFSKIKYIRVLARYFKLIMILRSYKIEKVFSVTPLLNRFLCLYVLMGLYNGRLIIEDHAYPPRSYKDEFPGLAKRKFFEKTEWLYKYSTIMRVLTNETLDYYKKNIPNVNAVAYPNLMDFERILNLSVVEDDLKSYDIVYIGRFETQKNILYLIKILSEYLIKNNRSMLIIGYGSLENEIKKLIINLELIKYVEVIPSGNLNYKYLMNSKVFPFVSIWEGYPLILIEAMLLGVPIVSFDCKTGPRELLGIDSARGWLIPEGDSEKFIEAVDEAINNIKIRDDKISRALNFVKSKNEINKNFNEYVGIFID